MFVSPISEKLVDRTGILTLGTTDPNTATVYLSSELYGELLRKVLIHELSHCVMVSYGCPQMSFDAEEWVCNFIIDYGTYITNLANELLKGE